VTVTKKKETNPNRSAHSKKVIASRERGPDGKLKGKADQGDDQADDKNGDREKEDGDFFDWALN
jgi:hypothetical protein